MPSDHYPTADVANPPDPDDGVRLEAATTLIPDDAESELPGSDPGGAVATVPPTPALPPPLRIILALRPCPGEVGVAPTYDVTISADRGKDADCDPYWRSFAGLDLPCALDEAFAVVAAAEEQWRANPRYPRVVSQPATGGKGKVTPAAKRTPAAPTAVLPSAASPATAPAGSAARSTSPLPAAIPAPRATAAQAESGHATEVGEGVAPAASNPPLPSGTPKPGTGKPGDTKQLSLFG